ncbi:hypothetical protein H3Z85_22470 [Chryseobacterium indologenes]|uniref:Uncharacterized protein n=1 Tax=Chryseobacterium indologenes TaxID=253 RepID=A0A4U8VJI7_CHRID|nr:hypothetical protein [Chryseobacterium indologenes]ASE61937.1 hypothetical protein CEQ15_10780 [Chryseobacterium indologenes]AZB17769.1 hypothetical protein EG352_08280 [Chryseobacterium indologenes]QPQ51909.1 hypothetical protein H3Z85_22470 [Chryseobacterium indologenes]TLX24359.1 hypothetical protein FE904_16960 [Chryseobacterium indologenes]SFI64912.1 hypothetical protein SAMN05421692_0319 [Chryseobacterium indologenes]
METQDHLKPLSFDTETEEVLKPLSFEFKKDTPEDFVPIAKTISNDIKNKESNFVFFFGTAESGKSVILSSMLYYLRSYAGVLRPKLGTPNSKEANVLLSDFFENIRQGILPNRTTRDQVTRLDLVFEPNNKSKKVVPIDLTFLETSGENHNDIRRGGSYHSSIESFLNANIPLTFIIVTSYESAYKDDSLINEFLDELERKGKNLKSVNAILVVSKWDKSGRMDVESAEELDNFISERLPMTSQRIDTYGLSKTYYTIGSLQNATGQEKIDLLNLSTAEVLSKWLYRSIIGYDLDYEGTFWERLKFSFTS